MKQMKAVSVYAYGGIDVLRYEDAPRPHPGPGELLIQVHAVGVNPLDLEVRRGRRQADMPFTLPLVLGWDVSGVVVAHGSKIKSFKEGDAVIAYTDPRRDGAYAEYCVVKESELVLKPDAVDHGVAAALPLAGLTAWQCLVVVAGITLGQRVLIHGAAGGVGHLAVQLAKWKGAWVIGTSSQNHLSFLAELGADEGLDRLTLREKVSALEKVDVLFDVHGDAIEQGLLACLNPGGILVSLHGPPALPEAAHGSVRVAHVDVQANAPHLRDLAHLVQTKVLLPRVENTFPLERAGLAHEFCALGHTRGKTVLRVKA